MPSRRTHIDKDEFQRAVNYLENNNSYRSPSALWQAVASSQWARTLSRPLSARTIADRARELEIIYDTRLRRLRNAPFIPRKTERVDYLYRVTFKERGINGIQCRDLRINHRIVTKDDVERVELILKGKLIGQFRIKDD